uniref:Uncharacterized protein n=1 Tax=Anguilla anguilla TaxID=7936 RepID=A0A0E9U4N7_ANGAN
MSRSLVMGAVWMRCAGVKESLTGGQREKCDVI